MSRFLYCKGELKDKHGITLKNVSIYHEGEINNGKMRFVAYINNKPVRVYKTTKNKSFYIKDKSVSLLKLAYKINKIVTRRGIK